MRLDQVPRVKASQFQCARVRHEPRVVLENALNWSAFARWRPEYLAQAAGDRTIPIRCVTGPPTNIYANLTRTKNEASFRGYLQWVLETSENFADVRARLPSDVARAVSSAGFEESYYLDIPLEDLSPALMKDVEVPNWYSISPSLVMFWCGVFGSSSGLHFDIHPNCNVQVIGEKHFILFSPTESRSLYPKPNLSNCRFDPCNPDFDKYPLARKARGFECTLAAGECLYIPPGWYHQVTVTSPWAVNVNFWWRTPWIQALLTPVLRQVLLRRLLVRKLPKTPR